jgi:hypothetical protein
VAAGGLIYTAGAEARMSGPRTTQKAQICGFIQDSYDQDTEDMDHAIDTEEWIDILFDRDYWVSQWHAQGCDTLYGSLGRLVPAGTMQSAPITSGNIQRAH